MNSCKGDELWTKVEQSQTYRLRAHTFNDSNLLNKRVWREINFNLSQVNINNMFPLSNIAYDGNTNMIFRAGNLKIVYVFSASNENVYQLLSSEHIKRRPNQTIEDKDDLMMYILLDANTIEVFQLLYEYYSLDITSSW